MSRWLKAERYKIFCPDSLDVDLWKALVRQNCLGAIRSLPPLFTLWITSPSQYDAYWNEYSEWGVDYMRIHWACWGMRESVVHIILCGSDISLPLLSIGLSHHVKEEYKIPKHRHPQVCTHTHTHTHTHKHTMTHTNTCKYIHTLTHKPWYIQTHIHTHTHTQTNTYSQYSLTHKHPLCDTLWHISTHSDTHPDTYKNTNWHTHTLTHTNSHPHSHIQTYTHTYTMKHTPTHINTPTHALTHTQIHTQTEHIHTYKHTHGTHRDR